MKIILSKPSKITEKFLKGSMMEGLNGIRLDSQNEPDVTLQGDNRTLTVIIHNNIQRNKRWLLGVCSNYCIPYQVVE